MNDEAGTVGIWVALAVALVFGGAVLAIVAAADVNIAAARARNAADAAALAGMAASPIAGGSGDPAEAAEALAIANGATVVDIDRSGWPVRFALTVQVRPRAPLVRRLAPDSVTADAAAGVRPARSARESNDLPPESLDHAEGPMRTTVIGRSGRGYAGRNP